MKKAKRISALVMAMAIAVSLLAAMPLTASASTNRASTPKELRSYLQAQDNADGTVIEIEKSFEYDYPILLTISKATDKGIKINLNGNDITMTRGIGLFNGTLTINGPGSLTIIGTPALLVDGSRSHFKCTGGADITVKTRGNTTEPAITVIGGASVNVSKDVITAGDRSTAVIVDKGIVEIGGNVSASGQKCIGVVSKKDSRVTVSGNVNVSGVNSTGVYANNTGGKYTSTPYHINDHGMIEVGGNVTATSSGSCGAYADNGTVIIKGFVSGGGYDVRVGLSDRYADNPHKTDQLYNRRSYDLFESGNSRIYVKQRSDGTKWQSDGKDYYYYRNYSMVKNSWVNDGDAWYYLDEDGKMVNEKWMNLGSKWYYFTSSGAMATGWLQQGSTWYFLKSNGAMAANESLTINGKDYNFDTRGKCLNP